MEQEQRIWTELQAAGWTFGAFWPCLYDDQGQPYQLICLMKANDPLTSKTIQEVVAEAGYTDVNINRLGSIIMDDVLGPGEEEEE